VLERRGRAIGVERSSEREPLEDAGARELLSRARRVRLARGRKISETAAAGVTLDDLKGPTGNYRAPLLLVGSTLLVGFQPESLAELL
jgi:hypothetical protein